MAEGRAAEIKEERRRRTFDGGPPKRLHVPEGAYDPKTHVARFVNNAPGRIRQMQEIGYRLAEPVAEPGEKARGRAATPMITAHAGVGPSGESMKAVLMIQSRNHYEEDARAKARVIDDREKAMNEGPLVEHNIRRGGERD